MNYFPKSEIYVAYKDVLDGKGDEDLELSAFFYLNIFLLCTSHNKD